MLGDNPEQGAILGASRKRGDDRASLGDARNGARSTRHFHGLLPAAGQRTMGKMG